MEKSLLGAERRRSPFFTSPVFLGHGGLNVAHFRPTLEIWPKQPKKKGYAGPAISSGLVI